MYRAHVVPHEYVALRPLVAIAIFFLQLMLEEKIEYFGTTRFWQLIDANGIARIGIQYLTTGDRVHQENGVRNRWLFSSLLFGQRRARAALFASHHFPKLIEIVRHRHAVQFSFEVFRKILKSRVHIAEFSVA